MVQGPVIGAGAEAPEALVRIPMPESNAVMVPIHITPSSMPSSTLITAVTDVTAMTAVTDVTDVN